MIRVTGSCISGLVICLFYYLALHVLDKNGSYGFPRIKNLIRHTSIFVVGIFTFIVWVGYSLIQPETFLVRYLADLCMICGLAVLTITDWTKHIIPNKVLLVLLGIWACMAALMILFTIEAGMAFAFTSLAGGLVGGIIFLLCYLLSKKQLGAGDVKLVFVLGLYLTGERIIGAIFYGVILCCIFSLIQLCRKKISMKDGVPLVPFLYLGTVITLLIL